jgi:hypothetical protein
MKRKIVISIVFFLTTFAEMKAQEIDPIQTDRPDQTESPSITPVNQMQMEIGFVYEKTALELNNFTHPNILTKFGISNRLELRLVTDIGTYSLNTQGKKIQQTTLNPTLIGCKVNIFQEKNYLPKTSLILHVGLPAIASKEYTDNNVFNTFRFLMQHTLNEKVSLSYNLGIEWDGSTPNATGIYTLALGYALSKKLGSFIELYGFATQYVATMHQYDMGFTYLLSKDMQFDVSGGIGLNKIAPDYFVSCGFSFRTGH